MFALVTNVALAGLLFSPSVSAILAAPNSPCEDKCGNVPSNTAADELVCTDNAFASNTGSLLEGCLQCEMNSPYHTGNQSDVQASLYNIRYTVAHCVFGYNNTDIIDSPCMTTKACQPFQNAVIYKNMSKDYDSYQYCDLWDLGDKLDFAGCTQCLQAGDNFYLANFVTYLQAGCIQKPEPGIPVAIEGNLFSNDKVNVTEPTPIAKVDPAWFDHGPLNLGAKVGIVVGGLVLLLMIIGFCIVWNGKRRRRAYLRKLEAKYLNKGWPAPHPNPHGDMTDTPMSQRPLRGWDDSPLSPAGERNYPKHVSPYSSQFTTPVSALDATNMQWPASAPGVPKSIGVAFSPVGAAYSPEIDTKGKAVADSYELHEVESPENYAPGHHGAMIRNEHAPFQQPGHQRNDVRNAHYTDHPADEGHPI